MCLGKRKRSSRGRAQLLRELLRKGSAQGPCSARGIIVGLRGLLPSAASESKGLWVRFVQRLKSTVKELCLV